MKAVKSFTRAFNKQALRNQSSVISVGEAERIGSAWDEAIPYKNVPGPKALPLLGNTWRFIPYVGKYFFLFFRVLLLNHCHF